MDNFDPKFFNHSHFKFIGTQMSSKVHPPKKRHGISHGFFWSPIIIHHPKTRIPYNPKTYFYINIIIWNPKDMHPYYIQYQYLSMLCIQLDGVTPCNSHQPARVIHAAKSRRSRPAGCRPRSPRTHRQWAPPRFLRLLAELTYPRTEKCVRIFFSYYLSSIWWCQMRIYLYVYR